MDFEGLKSAWKEREDGFEIQSPTGVSRSQQYLRSSVIRDVQRSEELSRPLFSVLFALAAIGASWVAPPGGAARIIAALLALALFADAVSGMLVLVHRVRQSSAVTLLEFISREHRQAESRMRMERYSQTLVFALAGIAVLVLILAPRPVNLNDDILRMAVVTAFLVFAWRRAKSRPHAKEIRRELEGYLQDLEG